jgi:hypothetical protein
VEPRHQPQDRFRRCDCRFRCGRLRDYERAAGSLASDLHPSLVELGQGRTANGVQLTLDIGGADGGSFRHLEIGCGLPEAGEHHLELRHLRSSRPNAGVASRALQLFCVGDGSP